MGFFYFCHDDNTVSMCLIVIKKDWFLQALGFNLECQFAPYQTYAIY